RRRVVRLTSDIAQRAADLPVLDLVEDLSAELEVVTLLVDRKAAVADDVDALLDVLDEVVDRERRLSGLQRDVRHPLELNGSPAVSVATAMRLLLADDVRLIP